MVGPTLSQQGVLVFNSISPDAHLNLHLLSSQRHYLCFIIKMNIIIYRMDCNLSPCIPIYVQNSEEIVNRVINMIQLPNTEKIYQVPYILGLSYLYLSQPNIYIYIHLLVCTLQLTPKVGLVSQVSSYRVMGVNTSFRISFVSKTWVLARFLGRKKVNCNSAKWREKNKHSDLTLDYRIAWQYDNRKTQFNPKTDLLRIWASVAWLSLAPFMKHMYLVVV